MVVLSTTYVPLHYTLCQCYHRPFYVIVDCVINAAGHGKEVVDGFNAIYKRFLLQLM